MTARIIQTPVLVPADGVLLAGRIHRNIDNLTDPQPGVVATGSWLTVKEQMADLYAARLAVLGYTVLTIDFAGFGQSGGAKRQTEMPTRKIADILAATRFLSSLSCVRGDSVGYLAICASAMYAAAAIDQGAPVSALASIAGWFHDAESVAAYYGGAEGVAMRIERARQAIQRYVDTGEDTFTPAYAQGNDRAGMFIELDYYANPSRGAIPAWRNEMSEMSWLYWLTFDGIGAAKRLKTPTLFVHGDECAMPENVKVIHKSMPGAKTLIWKPGFQVDYYDRPDLVDLAVSAAEDHFRKEMRQP